MQDTPLDRVSRAMPDILRNVEREIAGTAALDRLAAIAAEQRLANNVDALGRACSALTDD